MLVGRCSPGLSSEPCCRLTPPPCPGTRACVLALCARCTPRFSSLRRALCSEILRGSVHPPGPPGRLSRCPCLSPSRPVHCKYCPAVSAGDSRTPSPRPVLRFSPEHGGPGCPAVLPGSPCACPHLAARSPWHDCLPGGELLVKGSSRVAGLSFGACFRPWVSYLSCEVISFFVHLSRLYPWHADLRAVT